MCSHQLWDQPDSPTCTRTTPHEPGRGCTYIASTGSDVDDRHTEGGHG